MFPCGMRIVSVGTVPGTHWTPLAKADEREGCTGRTFPGLSTGWDEEPWKFDHHMLPTFLRSSEINT